MRRILLQTSVGLAASSLIPITPASGQISARRDLRFSDSWRFYRGDVPDAHRTSFADDAWESVCLPHTVRLESAISHSNYDYYKGICWYRKTFTPDRTFEGKKVFIEFEAAMQSTDVYLNGEKIYSYLGGYNPFIIDITDKLKLDSGNVIAVRLDNRVNTDVSPGNSAPDFYYYGGLYRYVNLHVTDRLHITDAVFADKIAGGGVFITTPSVSSSSADVQVKTHIINEYKNVRSGRLITSIIGPDGTAVLLSDEVAFNLEAGKDTSVVQRLKVAGPRLWSPDSPNLYRVRSEVFENERLADMVTTVFGIRTVSFSRSGGCTINGRRFKSVGANRHQDYGAIGNAVPVSGHYRDALRLKEGGFNFVRLSHYLQHPSFLDACDRLGIAVQASLVGWQYNGFSNPKFVENSLRDLRVMIRCYRNHPSVIMWESVHNESDPPASFARAAHAAAHEEFPGEGMFTCGQETNNVLDVYQAAVQQGGRTYSTSRPAAISEYGHWEEGGFTSTSNRTRADGEKGMLEQAENHVWGANQNHGLSWLSVDAVWVYNDYFGMSQYEKSLCSGGVVDVFRIPKFSYYCYRAQRDPSVVIPGVNSGPSVFIASHWTKTSSLALWVFSNCEKVSLYLNDNLIETRTPDNNYPNIGNPTFTFKIPSFQAGALRADGLIGGKVVASHTVKTPKSASAVAVVIDTASMQLLADGADLAIVYGCIVDEAGTVIPDASDRISFSVSGPGRIVSGDGNPVSAVAGIAAVYVQTKLDEPGLITVSASSGNLRPGSATVRSAPAPAEPVRIASASPPLSLASVTASPSIVCRGSRLIVRFPVANNDVSTAQLHIYDIMGRLIRRRTVYTRNSSTLELTGMASNVFCGRLTIGNRIYSRRLAAVRN